MARRRSPDLALLLALPFVGGAAGCLTSPEVAAIVAQSNATVIGADAPLLSSDAPLSPAAARETVERIDEFIAQHPDQPTVVSPLRLRQAVLHLRACEPNLAAAAFDQVDPSHLTNERDRKFHANADGLVWWTEFNKDSCKKGDAAPEVRPMSNADKESARAALDTIARTCDPLPTVSDVCRFLERRRMRIADRLARAEDDPPAVAGPALQRYLAQFRDDEWPAIRAWHCNARASVRADALREARWYDYVPEAVKRARDACSDPATGPVCGLALPAPAAAALSCS